MTTPEDRNQGGIPEVKIALIHNWPNMRNSELELIGRIRRVLSQLGHQSEVIDPFGSILDTAGLFNADQGRINPEDFDFCLNLHYTNPNFLDCLSYVVNWNPYHYIVRDPSTGKLTSRSELNYLSSCLRTHDIILSADSAKTDQLVAALADRPDPGQCFPDLRLHPTCQLNPDIGPVSLDSFRVFYIGVNWERLVTGSRSRKRHDGLLELLDATNRVDFYGVHELYGVNPWEGFNNYKGELPFNDGLSIVRTANQCGVALVLSSSAHRDSAVVSTRIFQACAARAIIISDDNPFIARHFGDAVLTFPYSSDPHQAFEHIRTLIEWIERHPVEAAEKAERAHRIFASRFSLDQEIRYLVESHPANRESIDGHTLPVDRSEIVDVVFDLGPFDPQALADFATNLNRQQAVSPHALVGCIAEDESHVGDYLRRHANFRYKTIPHDAVNGTTVAFMFRAVIEQGQGQCFCIYRASETWKRRHLAHLLRTMQDGSTLVSQTHGFVSNTVIATHSYDRSLSNLAISGELVCLRADHLATFAVERFSSSSFLFHRKLLEDNYESAQHIQLFAHTAYFYLLLLNYVVYRTLPPSTHRLTQRFDRDGSGFSIYDLEDDHLNQALHEEIATLAGQFRYSQAGRELATLAAALGSLGPGTLRDEYQHYSMYVYLQRAFRNRPRLLTVLLRVYNAVRYVLRLPPYPTTNAR